MTTVSNIAQTAFDAVARAITDAILPATLDDGASTYSGRVVLGGDTAPAGFPLSDVNGRMRPAYLEGFSAVAEAGWAFVADGVTYHVMGARDIVQAGGFQVVTCIADADLLWRTATFQKKTRTPDGAGGWTITFPAIAAATNVQIGLWAVSGSEVFSSERTEAQTRYKAVAAKIDGLLEADRVLVDGKTYAISFLDDVEGRGVWHIMDLADGVAT